MAERVINLLPGPVAPHPDVWQAFCAPPLSHRAALFIATLQNVKENLCALVNARHVELLLGSGTLANEVVGAHLAALPGRGAILSNGEFGERLIDHGSRLGLQFTALRTEWGAALDYEALEGMAASIGWVWFVHCETSTGRLNDLCRLATLCRERNIHLCVDAISSIGATPVDLGAVFLASCVASKGLGALPGLATVFYNQTPLSANGRVPRYLDLNYYAENDGVPFTTSSNLLFALRAALTRLEPQQRFARIQTLASWLHEELIARGLNILVPPELCSPAVITIVLPPTSTSLVVGEELERHGYLLSYRSRYLLQRNLIQICLMSELNRADLLPLPALLAKLIREQSCSTQLQ